MKNYHLLPVSFFSIHYCTQDNFYYYYSKILPYYYWIYYTEFHGIFYPLSFFFIFIQKKTNAFRPTIFSPSSSCRMIMRSFFLGCVEFAPCMHCGMRLSATSSILVRATCDTKRLNEHHGTRKNLHEPCIRSLFPYDPPSHHCVGSSRWIAYARFLQRLSAVQRIACT